MKRIISIILTFTILFSMSVTASVSAATATTAEPYDIVKWDGTITIDNKGTISEGPVVSGSLYPTGGITTTKYAISVLSGGTGTGLSTVERSTGDNCYSIDYSKDLRYDPSTNFNFYSQVTNAKLNKPVFSVVYDIMIPNDANANAERTFTPSFTTANGKSGALGSTDYGEFVVKYANGAFTVDSLVGIDTTTSVINSASYTPGSWVTVEVRAYYDATTTKLTYGVYIDDAQIFYGVGTTLYPSMIYLDRALWHQPSIATNYDNICMRVLLIEDKPVAPGSQEPDPDPNPDPNPNPDPKPGVNPYEGGTLLFSYDLNKNFAETELGKRVIIDKFDSVEKYNTEISYEDDGIKISHKGEPVFTNDEKTGGATVDAFGINLTELMYDNDGNAMYKTGYNGIYALEYTFNAVQGDGWDGNKSTGRADLFIDDSTGTFENKNNIEIRMPFKPTPKNQVVYWNDKDVLFNLPSFENGKDMTVCFIIDTKTNTVEGYGKLEDDTFEKVGQGSHSLTAITGLWYRIRSYCQDGDSITFKNIKLYELEKNSDYSGNLAYDKFNANLPAEITDSKNVVDNIVIPEAVTKAGTVSTLNEDLVKVDGTVTRRFKDTKTGITVSGNSNGIYYEKVYGFTVKAMEGAENTKLADYDFASEKVYGDFVNAVNGTATADGFKLINNKQQGEAVGMLKVLDTHDTYTDTYYYDNVGAYDFNISLTPDITDGGAFVEVGNYTEDKGFVPFGTVKITADKIEYCGEDDIVAFKGITAGKACNINFRTYTDEKSMWISVNSKEISQLPYVYIADKNILNAYRVSFADGTANDSIVINDASFTRLLKSENTILKQTLDVADSISIYDVVEKPDNAYGDINLPKVPEYKITWTSDNPLANLEQGKVYCTEDDTNIVISAIITPAKRADIKVLKEFNIKVLGTDDPEYLLEGALAKIVPENITNQNPDALIADLKLPSITEEGYGITWDSLTDNIMSDSGVINKNINISEDTEVTLKATVVAPSGSASKEIKFVVAKRGKDIECSLADITENVENVVTYSAEVPNVKGSMKLCDENDNKIISFDIENSKIVFSNGTEYNIGGNSFLLKAVMNSADRKVSVFINEELVLDYIDYAEKAKGFKLVSKSGITLTNEKVIIDEYALFDYNVKVFDYFDNFGEGYINSNVVLKTNSVGGVNVVWTSSDNGILSNNGTYTATDSIAFFNMTAKLSVDGGTGAYYENVVECVAVPGEDKNVFENVSVITDIKEDVNNDTTKIRDNNFGTYFSGTRLNENSYITIDMGGLNDINSVYLFREADDNNIKSCDVYVSENGVEWSGPVASVNFTDLKSNHIKFDLQTTRFVKIANIVTESKSIKLFEIKAYVSYSSDDKAYKDIMALNMPGEYVLNQDYIILPTVGSLYGSTLEWKTSNESVITKDGNIIKPSGKKEVEVVLTVTATYEGKTSVKSFKYLVCGSGNGIGGAGGAGGSGGGGGNIAGVNAGGTTITALPSANDIVQTPSNENLNTEFKDVKVTDWYYTYLMNLKNKGIIDGYEDGNFYPNNKITREEFVKLLVNIAGIELVEEYEGFEDVNKTDWFAPYVYTAKKLNIVSGIDDTNFGVGMPISRQDMSVMIYNLITMNKDVSASKEKFADDGEIAEYASDAVYSMKSLEVLNGYEDSTFKPLGQLTRAEAAKVITLIANIK